MPGVTLPPNQTNVLSGGLARTERIERRTVNPNQQQTLMPMVFSYPGTLTANVESPAWYPNRNLVVTTVRVSLLANASTNHVVEVRVDGAAIQQFTLTSGAKTVVAASAIAVGTGSYVTVKTITVADTNLSVELGLQ